MDPDDSIGDGISEVFFFPEVFRIRSVNKFGVTEPFSRSIVDPPSSTRAVGGLIISRAYGRHTVEVKINKTFHIFIYLFIFYFLKLAPVGRFQRRHPRSRP